MFENKKSIELQSFGISHRSALDSCCVTASVSGTLHIPRLAKGVNTRKGDRTAVLARHGSHSNLDSHQELVVGERVECYSLIDHLR